MIINIASIFITLTEINNEKHIGYWTRAIKRFALFDLLKSLYSDTKILSKYIPSAETIINDAFSYSENV